jgi:hypothetical protein
VKLPDRTRRHILRPVERTLRLFRHVVFALGLLSGIAVWFVENPEPSSWAGRTLAPRYLSALTAYRHLIGPGSPISHHDEGFAELRELATIVSPQIPKGYVVTLRSGGFGFVPSGNGIFIECLDAEGHRVDDVWILNPETAIKKYFFDRRIRVAKGVLSFVAFAFSACMYIEEVVERRRRERRDAAERTRVNEELATARSELSNLKSSAAALRVRSVGDEHLPLNELIPDPQDRSDRFKRFERLFHAQDTLGDLINDVLDNHEDQLKIREGEEHDLSLLTATSFGKGMKTYQAIVRLCLIGYGEDALVLLRSNINLLINVAYVLAAPNPIDRANDFVAYSYNERVKYLRIAHDVKTSPWKAKMSDEEFKRRAEAWESVSLSERARISAASFHYDIGYRIYSSFEHSDAFALNDYIQDWNEKGPLIQSGASDNHIGIALVHSFGVMADLFMLVCRYFAILRPDIAEKLGTMWKTLQP